MTTLYEAAFEPQATMTVEGDDETGAIRVTLAGPKGITFAQLRETLTAGIEDIRANTTATEGPRGEQEQPHVPPPVGDRVSGG